METAQISEVFLPLRRAAARLGVPAAWLRAEALAGRVPFLSVGRRLLFNTAAVESALLERSRQAQAQENSDTQRQGGQRDERAKEELALSE